MGHARAGPDCSGRRVCVSCLSDRHTLPWEKLWAGCRGRADLQAGGPGGGGPAKGGGGGGAEIVSRGRCALDSGGQVKGRSTGSATSRGGGKGGDVSREQGKSPSRGDRTCEGTEARAGGGTAPGHTPSACTPPSRWGSQAVTLLPAHPVCRRLLWDPQGGQSDHVPVQRPGQPHVLGQHGHLPGLGHCVSQPSCPMEPRALVRAPFLGSSSLVGAENILERGRQTSS